MGDQEGGAVCREPDSREQFEAEDDGVGGTQVHVSGHGVLVHGLGGVDEVLRELVDIAAAAERSRSADQSEPRTARKFDSKNEFEHAKTPNIYQNRFK